MVYLARQGHFIAYERAHPTFRAIGRARSRSSHRAGQRGRARWPAVVVQPCRRRRPVTLGGAALCLARGGAGRSCAGVRIVQRIGGAAPPVGRALVGARRRRPGGKRARHVPVRPAIAPHAGAGNRLFHQRRGDLLPWRGARAGRMAGVRFDRPADRSGPDRHRRGLVRAVQRRTGSRTLVPADGAGPARAGPRSRRLPARSDQRRVRADQLCRSDDRGGGICRRARHRLAPAGARGAARFRHRAQAGAAARARSTWPATCAGWPTGTRPRR